VFREPTGFWGRIGVLVGHPRTIVKALERMIGK